MKHVKPKLDFKNDTKLYLRLLKYIVPYKGVFAVGVFALIALALTEPALAAMMKPLLEGTFVEKDPDHIFWMPILLIALAAFRGLFSFVGTIAIVSISGRLVLDLRTAMMEKLLVLSTEFYDHHSTGNVITKLTHNVTQVTTAATNVITVLVRDSVKVVGLFAYALYLNWMLTLLILLVVPPITLVVNYFAKRSRHYSREMQEAMGDLTQLLEEAVHGHKVVKVFGGQTYEKHRFVDVANWLRRYQFKIKSAAAANVPIVELMATLLLAGIVYLVTSDWTGQQMSVGGFASFFTALALIISPIKSLAGISQPLQRGLAAAESVFGLIDQEPEPDAGRETIRNPAGRVEFDHVHFRYSNSAYDVLHGISFEIPVGHTVALVGPSGSGKTTIANLLPRFYNASGGMIRIDGIDTAQMRLADLRNLIALVNQDLVLFNDTIAANITYGLRKQPSQEALERAARLAHANEFIDGLPDRFDTLIGDNGVLLSGGQRQRLAIARAILKNAPVLILDEATSALDTESERMIQNGLEVLKRDRTTLVIAHRLSTIERADEILVLQQGRITERGTHKELLAHSGLYADLYRKQFKDPSRQQGSALSSAASDTD